MQALSEILTKQTLNLNCSLYGSFEWVDDLGFELPRKDAKQTARAGDLMLYQGRKLVLFHNENRWAYTKLGQLSDLDWLAQFSEESSLELTISVESAQD